MRLRRCGRGCAEGGAVSSLSAHFIQPTFLGDTLACPCAGSRDREDAALAWLQYSKACPGRMGVASGKLVKLEKLCGK